MLLKANLGESPSLATPATFKAKCLKPGFVCRSVFCFESSNMLDPAKTHPDWLVEAFCQKVAAEML